MTQNGLYRKFCESKQEKLRLEIALEGFFHKRGEGTGGKTKEPEVSEGAAKDVSLAEQEEWRKQREDYARYLQNRIRPAMELLIRQNDLGKIESLAEQGWIGEVELEGFIQQALQQENRGVLLWLLQFKNKTFGFKDREFLL